MAGRFPEAGQGKKAFFFTFLRIFLKRFHGLFFYVRRRGGCLSLQKTAAPQGWTFILDDFAKSSSASLRCILSHCDVQQARLVPSDLRAPPRRIFNFHLKLFTLSPGSRLFTGPSFLNTKYRARKPIYFLFKRGSRGAFLQTSTITI